MADYETRVERVERTTLVLPSPTNWVEVTKAFAAARQMVVARGEDPDWDNIVLVHAADDEILIRLPERELDVQVGRVEAAHVAYDTVRDLVRWVSSCAEAVGGPQTAGDVVRMLEHYDPNNPPFGTAAAK